MVFLLGKKQIEDITVSELVKIADVGKSTFYRHYHDIYDVFDEITEGFASRALGIMLRLVFSDSPFEKIGKESIISVGEVMELFGLEQSDMVLVNYLFDVKSMKTFHLVVERFRAIVKEYALKMNVDGEQADYYTKFVMNGLLYSTLNDYKYNGTLNLEFVKLLRSFSLDDWVKGGAINGKSE